LEAEGSFNMGVVSLPNRAALVEQLKSLVRKVHAGGRDSVDTDSGQPEDEANVVAGLIDLLSARASGAGAGYAGFSKHNFYDVGGGLEMSGGDIEKHADGSEWFEGMEVIRLKREPGRPNKVITTSDLGRKS
jgi:hypothetical protein